MKGMFKKFAALVAVMLFWSSQANALLIEIVPSTTNGNLGDLVTVDIVATDLGTDYITAYDILIAFDETVLQFDDYDIGCGLGACDAFPVSFWAEAADHNPAAGLAGVGELSLIPDFFLDFSWYQDGSDFTLFTLNFTARADFKALDLAFVWDDFHDVKCVGSGLDACYPTTVPEPGTLALLGLGLLGLAATRRRQKI